MIKRNPEPRSEICDASIVSEPFGGAILLAVGALIAIWLPAAIFLLS